MKFGVYETLIKNRISSVQSMVSEVFMKQVRRSMYDRVYENDNWKGRLIMNAIYDLTPREIKQRDEEYRKILSEELRHPDPLLIETAEKARSMGTTLWFTPKEVKGGSKKNMLNTLIASGQFTACFNLLDYIEKVMWNPANRDSYNKYPDTLKKSVQDLHDQLMADWRRFNKDPYWMTDPFNPHPHSVPKK
jgi:hypothetical protein